MVGDEWIEKERGRVGGGSLCPRVRTFVADADQGGRSDVAVTDYALAVALCGVVVEEGCASLVLSGCMHAQRVDPAPASPPFVDVPFHTGGQWQSQAASGT